MLRVGLLIALLATGTLAGTALVVRRPVLNPDAIISLASHEWERLPLTVQLATANPAAVVVLTEPQPVTQFNCAHCGQRVDMLRARGVAEQRVRVLPMLAPGTHGEALTALAFARETGIRRLMVVTSPYHTRRALATFRKVFEGTGIGIGIEPASDSSPAKPLRWWWAGYDRAYVAYEWAAIAYYAWNYHVSL